MRPEKVKIESSSSSNKKQIKLFENIKKYGIVFFGKKQYSVK